LVTFPAFTLGRNGILGSVQRGTEHTMPLWQEYRVTLNWVLGVSYSAVDMKTILMKDTDSCILDVVDVM
jgi:hypothetical protein